LTRFKIREKKPKDSIKHKTPSDKMNTQIKHKTPVETDESFELPPFKEKIKAKIPKSEIKSPTRHGIKNKAKSKSTESYGLPPKPIKGKKPRREKSTPPSSKGTVFEKNRKEEHISQKIPSEKPKKTTIQKVPKSTGSKKSKKEKVVNKPLSVIQNKKPKKEKVAPASLRGSYKEKHAKIVNKTPPKTIIQKTPAKTKTTPPPTIREKIPKTRIKNKKPR
jgi:hypothetical protein